MQIGDMNWVDAFETVIWELTEKVKQQPSSSHFAKHPEDDVTRNNHMSNALLKEKCIYK